MHNILVSPCRHPFDALPWRILHDIADMMTLYQRVKAYDVPDTDNPCYAPLQALYQEREAWYVCQADYGEQG